MEHHLGYPKNAAEGVNYDFKTTANELEDRILAMYAEGLSTWSKSLFYFGLDLFPRDFFGNRMVDTFFIDRIEIGTKRFSKHYCHRNTNDCKKHSRYLKHRENSETDPYWKIKNHDDR
jgi:hypothetical protein